MTIVFQDDDAPLPNEDMLNVVLPAAPGINFVAGPNGFVTYRSDWVLTPQFDPVCEGQPAPSERASFGAAQPGLFNQVGPGETTSFTFTFTNTGTLTETFSFRVVPPLLVEPDEVDINPETFVGLMNPADPAWAEIATPGAGTGILVGPGQQMELEVFVTPAAAPAGYYELEVEALSLDFGDIVAETQAIIQLPLKEYLPLIVSES